MLMEGKNLAVFWISLASILIIEGAPALAVFTSEPQSGCHSSDTIIDCKYFTQIESTRSARLKWQFMSENGWKTLGQVRRGNRKQFNNGHFGDRLVLHMNGSLEIKSLKPEDAKRYMCTVSQRGQKDKHVVELSVKCDGLVTITRQDVCVEDDVLLDCEAKHRTNPNNFKDIEWQKYEGKSWSLVVASYNNSTVVEDGTILHSNGTLLIPAGRQPGDSKYKCTVIKNIDRHLKEKHIVKLRNVKCHRERRVTKATIKTTKGRAAMTTSTPVPGTTVAMETTPSEYSPSSPSVQSSTQATVVTNKESVAKTTATPTATTVAMETTSSKPISSSSSTQSTSTLNIQTTKGGVAMTTEVPVIDTTTAMKTTSESSPSTASVQSKSTVNVKTMEGRAAMTTAKPVLRTTVAMETTPEQSTSSSVSQSTASVELTTGRAAMTTAKPVLRNTAAMETASSEYSSVSPQSTSPTTAESQVCGGEFTSISGGFQSPNYPSAYPANSYCKWTITVPQDYTAIHISLDDMNLEHEDNCQNDYISITDELGNQVGCRQCGSYNKPITFQVQGRTALIVFSSDSTVHKTGFKLTFKAMHVLN